MRKKSLSLPSLIKRVAIQLKKENWLLATAESCTGGALAAAFTDIPGSSSSFDRGFVTYNNQAKEQMLGVSKTLLDQHGAVSERVVQAMAKNAVQKSQANVAISTSGFAGPDGGEPDNPIGTVWIGVCLNNEIYAQKTCFEGSRKSVKQQAIRRAFQYLLEILLSKSAKKNQIISH